MASVRTTTDDWLYDSSATTHVCNNKDLFKTYKETKDENEVMMGDNHTSKVTGSGNVEIQFTSGKNLTLMNVLHVPNIKKNLVSAFKLCKSGVKSVIESDKVLLHNTSKLGPRGLKGVFMGYAKDSKSYHYLDLDLNVIVESRDVDFFENKFRHDSTSTNEIVTQIPQDISGLDLNSNNKRNMAESSSARRRSEKARKERNLDHDFIDSQAIIFLVVDDIPIVGTNMKGINETKMFLSSCFQMKDMNEVDTILGIKVKRHNVGYALGIIDKFQHLNIEEANTPYESSFKLVENNGRAIAQIEYASAIGCLMYATHCTRPEIAYVVCKHSRYTSNPSQDHWKAIRRVFGYLKRTRQLALYYGRFLAILEGYSDASWITSSSGSKSTIGWIFTLGDGAFSSKDGLDEMLENGPWFIRNNPLILKNNMDSSMGKMCLGKDVIEISSDRNKGSRDWDSPEYKDTSRSEGKKEPEALINLEKNDNLISNDYAVKLYLKYEVRKGKKLVKKELMVLLRGKFTFDEEGIPNLDDLEMLLDFDIDEVPQIEIDLPPMVCKMGKGSRNKKKVMENIMYFNNGVGPSSSIGIPLTQEEAEKRALAHNISMRYEILEEVRPVIETLAFSDKYRKLLDEIWADKIRLDGMIKPKEEKAIAKMKEQMLKEKKDLGAFIFPIRLEGRINENALADTQSDTNTMPYRIYEQLGRDDIMKEDRNITMINYTEAEVTGQLVNVLCQVGFTALSAKFLILEIPVDRDAPIMVGHGFLDTIIGNIDIPNMIFTTFDGCTRQTFRAARSEKIRIAESDSDDKEDYAIKRNDMGTPIHNSRPIGYQNNTNPAENMTLSNLESTSGAYDHEAGSSRAKRFRNVETVEEALLPDVHHEFLEWRGCSREAKSCYNSRLATLLPKLIYSPQIVDWQLLHKIGCGDKIDQMLKISLKEAQSDEDIFFSVAWVRAFNIREPIYTELCSEFYATYEFDEVYADDELQSKKIISFRLGGRAHSLTLLEFARRLGLYHAEELEEEGFDTYFQGGLRSDENFNAREYWERISIDRDLHLSRSSITSVRFPILILLSLFEDRHQNGYANMAWVIAKLMKRKGSGSQKDSQICCAPRVQRASMQDLYERMDSMKIRQEVIERMEYKHAYHWDRYQGVFEHMAGVYSVPLQGAYNPPSYA
ncbi:zinc finger, CCHC-type containing protein [Tanacetum coccineum]